MSNESTVFVIDDDDLHEIRFALWSSRSASKPNHLPRQKISLITTSKAALVVWLRIFACPA